MSSNQNSHPHTKIYIYTDKNEALTSNYTEFAHALRKGKNGMLSLPRQSQ